MLFEVAASSAGADAAAASAAFAAAAAGAAAAAAAVAAAVAAATATGDVGRSINDGADGAGGTVVSVNGSTVDPDRTAVPGADRGVRHILTS